MRISDWSSDVCSSDLVESITVSLPPDPPSLSVPGSSYTGTYTVSWNSPPGATRYRLEELSGSGAWNEIQVTSITSEILSGKGNGTFSYRVRACIDTSPSSCGGYSNIESVTDTLRPAPPSLTLPESSDTGNYTANWNSEIGRANV